MSAANGRVSPQGLQAMQGLPAMRGLLAMQGLLAMRGLLAMQELLAMQGLLAERGRIPMPALATTFERDLDADVIVLRARGRLDLTTARLMRTALAKCVAECPAAVVVDVTECRADVAAALAVFPASAHAQTFQPAVAVLLCGADDEFVRDGGAVVLGAVPRFATCLDALQAAQTTRASQQRVFLRAAASVRLPSQARDAVATACDRWGLGAQREAVVLILSELVTNAVRYTDGAVTVEAMMRGDFIHLRIRDESPLPPAVRPSSQPADLPDGGRGLPIVTNYSSAWGYAVNPDGAGKLVWATVRIRPLGSR